jgi:hypothetical protein
MAEDQTPQMALPTDEFSVAFRALDDSNAVHSSSRVDIGDFYGRRTTWTIDTFRVEGVETVFVQRISADGALRLVLPPEVTIAINRQHDRATTINRRRGAAAAVRTKREKGMRLGNPDALRKARRTRKR